MVAATQTINFGFGSGFMAPDTGVLLNNEMDDFSMKPGQPNGYQLLSAEANSIQPGKRMLSSMTPTILRTDDGVALLGSPGRQPDHHHRLPGKPGMDRRRRCRDHGVQSALPPPVFSRPDHVRARRAHRRGRGGLAGPWPQPGPQPPVERQRAICRSSPGISGAAPLTRPRTRASSVSRGFRRPDWRMAGLDPVGRHLRIR